LVSTPRDAERLRLSSARALAFVVGASLFVTGVAVFAVSRSPLFALRHVDVRGESRRSATDVLALAEIPQGANVLWLDTSAVADRLESDPWIARANVTRSLPWTLQISVEERRPIAVVTEADAATLVATDGTRLGPAGRGAGLPAIELPPAAPATIGPPGEDGAVRALGAMPPWVRERVRQVDVSVGGTLTAVMRGGAIVDLGPAVDLHRKARALGRLLAWERISGADVAAVSLVASTAPAVRFADAEAP
jgi:cell division protein FtsQ